MSKLIILCLIIALLPIVNAVCLSPNENTAINGNAVFCSGAFNIEKGISIINDNIVLDCNGSKLTGNGIGYGILLKEKRNVVVQNCNISNFEIGIYLDNTNNSIIKNNYLTKNKFGVALFNSFNNNVDGNLLAENANDNSITYLPSSFTQKKSEAEIKEIKEDASSPKKIMEEVIRIKKPFLKEAEILDEVNFIFDRYFSITQENLEIKRAIVYNESESSTRIILSLKPRKILLNASIYEKIPKCVSAYASQLLFETGDYEVVNEDPLILWVFSRLEDSKDITYKVPKKIDDECKNLLAAFGIAAGFEEKSGQIKENGGKDSKFKAANYTLMLLVVVIALFGSYFVYNFIRHK